MRIAPPARSLTGLIAVLLYSAAQGRLELDLAPLILRSCWQCRWRCSRSPGLMPWCCVRGIVVATLVLGMLLMLGALR